MGRSLRLATQIGCSGVVSFGVAGGLDSDLRPGDCIVASAVIDNTGLWPTDPLLSSKLLALVPDARHGLIAGVNSVVPDPPSKRELRRRTGAVAVDMESHLVARFAAAHALSCATLRVVIDTADRTLPKMATGAVRAGGVADYRELMRELVRPSQLMAMLRIANDAYVARSELIRLSRVLGSPPD